MGVAVMVLVFWGPPYGQQALGTTFTYQGHLLDGGAPADGLHDLRFQLFDAVAGGTQVGSTLCVDDVEVVEGLFTVQLDFGQQFATPDERHLEIHVRPDIGQPCTDELGYIPLSPRQLLTATPLASHANSAFALDAADGSPTSAVLVDDDGNVGISMLAPGARLDVRGDGDTSPGTGTPIARFTRGNGNNYLALFADIGGNYIVADDPADNQKDLRLQTRNNRNILLEPNGTGGVGIGTASPLAKLDVRGEVKLGSSGQYFAVKSNRKDRIVRGTVNTNGTVGAGTGFTVSHTVTGIYVINFDTAFATPPTVVASSIAQSRKIHVIQTQTTFASVGATDVSNTFADGGFTFIAMGE